MWAIGVIAYIVLCGYPPFDNSNVRGEMSAIINAEYEFHEEYWSDISDNGK